MTTSANKEQFALPEGCEEGYAETNGTRLHYVAAGTGPLVLLLHGFPAFWYSWRHQLPVLAGRFRVVAPDLRGYNLSEKPAGGYDLASLSADIRGLIEALGERHAHVVGHDWGGVVAWATAIRAPESVRRLVVVNAPHPAAMLRELRRPRQLWRSAYMGFFQLRGMAERAVERDGYALVRRTLRAADRGEAWLTDEDIARYVAAIARPGALTAALEYYRQLRHDWQALSPMRVVTAPTLVLWGELDPYMGVGALEGLDRWVREPRIRRFPTAGHWLNEQESERVNAELLAFLLE
ncbi:MAG TPA: alpha/beta hydrolase [Ktedonobacterales bacterium]|nr:alpha/beta hydrolase [Ktedonobacterales bacterium]